MIWDRLRQIARRSKTRRRAGRRKTRRRAERRKTALPVVMDFGGGSGVTHDVSLSGVFLETDIVYAVDSTVHFTIELPAPAGTMSMECSGTVIRVEKQGNKFGVAVKLRSQRLKLAKAI